MLPALIAFALRLLAFTWRVQQPAWPHPGPCVVAFWHGELLPMIALHRPGPGRPSLVGLASLSGDGEIVATALGALGYPVVRGSSSRGSVAALRALIATLAAGASPALAVDGPRGPAGRAHPGAEALAKRLNVPVVWGRIEAPGFRLRSWDRTLIPYPFARVRVRYGVWSPGLSTLTEALGPV